MNQAQSIVKASMIQGLTLEAMEKITGIRDNNLSAIENDRIEMSQHYAEVFDPMMRSLNFFARPSCQSKLMKCGFLRQ
jgi:hypothetical protein